MEIVKLITKPAGFYGAGLSVVGTREWLDASKDGALLAHDLLEHVNGIGAIGTVHDELMALGAYWFVRGQHGQVNGKARTIDPIEPLSREVARQIGLCTPLGSYGSRKPATWRPVSDAEREAPGPWDQALRRVANSAPGYATYSKTLVTQCADDALHYLRRGARLAYQKYGDANAVNRLFWDIRDALQPHADSASMGQEFELLYDLHAVSVRQTKAADPIPTYDPAFYFNGDAMAVDFKKVAGSFKFKNTGTTSGGAAVPQNMARGTLAAEAKATKEWVAKTYGPAHAQRNVYKEARYAK